MRAGEGASGRIWAVDVLHFVFFVLLAGVTLAHRREVAHAGWWLAFDVLAVAALVAVIHAARNRTPHGAAILRLVHGVFVVPLVFTQVGMIIQGARADVDFAPELERLDRLVFFGHNPIEALERISHPVLVEVMQWAYTSYLLLPVGFVLLLAWKGRGDAIARSLLALLGVMYASYVGYILVPAAGPNIHNDLGPLHPVSIPVLPLYDFTHDLPGVWLTDVLRSWMFQVELTKKDCFPSGHVAVALICWLLARRVDRRFGPPFFLVGLGVTLSTVVLRYHFVVDVAAGILLALVVDAACRAYSRRS
jgi:membrane-associated phospholipid phosphatase